MKVLHVIPSFAPAWRYGGPIVAVHGMTRALAALGHEVTVMTTNIDGPGVLDVPIGREVDMDGVKVFYYPVEFPRWYCRSRPLGKALAVRVPDFDIVHIHSVFLWPTTIASSVCRQNGVPYVLGPAGMLTPSAMMKTYSGSRVSLFSRMKKWLYMSTLGRRDIGGASALHFTSEAERVASRGARKSPQSFVLPLGVDLPAPPGYEGDWLRKAHPEIGDRKVVLFLSRIDPKKGLDVLLRAAATLDHRNDFVVVIAGNGPEGYESEMRVLAASLGLTDRVVFVGLVHGDDKWELLSSATMFVLPSHHENFGVAVVEAMAVGTPVVISDAVDLHNEVAEAEAGLVTKRDVADFAGAIARLLDNPDTVSEMGEAGRALVERKFAWPVVAKSIAEMYETVIGGSSSRASSR